jgi:hypothetical protein
MSMREATGRPSPDDRAGFYYVTIRDGDRHGLLAGPFKDDHRMALDMVPHVRAIAHQASPRQAAFAGFGTAWAEVDMGPGRLNHLLVARLEAEGKPVPDALRTPDPSSNGQPSIA